jgi:hypothetical protein
MLLAASGLAVYLGSKKFGYRLVAQYTISGGPFRATRISQIILINKKDKPIALYSVYAIFNGEVRLQLDDFKIPVIIKPFECISLPTQEYSHLSIGNNEFSPEFEKIDIYAEVDETLIKCESTRKPKISMGYREVMIHRCSYNDFVYDESVAYILVYLLDGKMKTAFIAKTGYIGNEWEFSPNFIHGGASPAAIKSFLATEKFIELFETHHILKVQSPGNVIDIESMQ